MSTQSDQPESIEATPYAYDEIVKIGDHSPTRGLYCFNCRTVIPQFADLNESNEKRVRHLILNDRRTMAMLELRAITGCSLSWAKIWIIHSGRPHTSIEPQENCPHCGKHLRAPHARQCRFCQMDWPDSTNLAQL